MKIAVITGASSGLGREYINELNRSRSGRPDEIWAVARREDRLLQIKEASEIPVRTISADLTDREQLESIGRILEEEQPDITLLINAAGFGKIGNYEKVTIVLVAYTTKLKQPRQYGIGTKREI